VKELLAFLDICDPGSPSFQSPLSVCLNSLPLLPLATSSPSFPEMKPYMTRELVLAAEKFAPNRRWHVDTFLQVLISVRPSPLSFPLYFLLFPFYLFTHPSSHLPHSKGGTHVNDESARSAVQLFANSPELFAYLGQRLFNALQVPSSPIKTPCPSLPPLPLSK
jgi:hypothetical protein